MSTPKLTIDHVRLIHLTAQGLLTATAQQATKMDVLQAIRRMGALQIDTISVVARSPYFVLFSRLGNYDPTWLDQLLIEKALFEQWARAASFLPIEDFPLFRRLTLEGKRVSYFGDWAEQNRTTLDHVLEVVRNEGPKRSADFESEKSPGGWWNWKIEKGALEYWLARGELMVARRDRFQRVYDLRERVLPDWCDKDTPPIELVQRDLVLKSVRCMGVARGTWVWNYFGMKKKLALALVEELVDTGNLRQVNVEGWEEPAVYLPEDESLIQKAANNELKASYTTLLSPFDPVVWDRDRARQMFNFDFKIQAYTPPDKRQYGYFPLPILHNGTLIGRLDAKAHRKDKVFEVRSLYLEEGISGTHQLVEHLAQAIKKCAEWHKTPEVIIRACQPVDLAEALTSSVKNKNQ